jgi:Family of unknown function (DUF6518)
MPKRLIPVLFALAGGAYGFATSYLPMPTVATTFWVGNLCAPWLVLAFVAGRSQTSWLWAVLGGMLTDAACVFGFYLRDPDPVSMVTVNGQWFVAALLAGSIYGALGCWWRRSQSLAAGLGVAAGFIAEPVLWPIYHGFYQGPWTLWTAEILVGLGVAARAVHVSRLRTARP